MRPYLSLCLLAYNERGSIESGARRCAGALTACGQTYELVLVDDGSTDGTAEIIDALAAELPHCRSIHHPRNLGIGAGVRTCYFQTQGEWATWFPADMQADPAELPRLLSHLPHCDVLATYRDPNRRQAGRLRKLISFTDRMLVRLLFGLDLHDLHWIRFFRREILERMRLSSRSPSIDTEMMVQAKRLGARILQVPLNDHARQSGEAKGATLKNVVLSVTDLLALRLRPMRLDPARAESSVAENKRAG
jgi:glycosyltransferase involved in cell wall biosynthesis